ncbi:MAG TPA: hypothetical protein PLP17_10100 [Oligoflexia bacterium]|nr:hypothetical protein [Oligoflexia bacterium]
MKSDEGNATGPETVMPAENEERVFEIRMSEMRRIVHNAVYARRTALVYQLARQVFEVLDAVPAETAQAAKSDPNWQQVESLSQLRAVVGGRFQNLKEKWIKAGLPLREHRGDRAERANLDMHGWLELASWISRQGFEVRLADREDSCLFEVRESSEARKDVEPEDYSR